MFELDQTSRLANLSTRGLVRTGDDVMIGGLIIQGNTDKTVIIRARGPSLAAAGVTGDLLADPFVYLVDQSDGRQLDNNNNWQDHPRVDEIPEAMRPT